MSVSSPPKKNTAHTFGAFLSSQANPNIFQSSATLAAGDVKVVIDEGAPANITTLPVVDADFTKRIKVDLSAAEMNGDKITILFSDAAGAEWGDCAYEIATVAAQMDDVVRSTTPANTLSVDASNNVGITQAGADKVWSSATRTLTALSTALALSIWDVLETAIATTSSIGLKVKNNLDAAISTRLAPAGTLATVTAVTNDVGITQTGADKVWSSVTRTLTAFSTALALSVWDVLEASIVTASSIGLKLKGFVFTSAGKVDASLRDWLGTAPSALIAGRVDANTQLVGTAAISSLSFTAGSIDAAAIAADAIGSAELAAAAAEKIADAILARNVAGGSNTGRLVKEALYVLRNRVAIAAGTLTAYQVDDATPAFTAVVTTTAGNPISEVDPA